MRQLSWTEEGVKSSPLTAIATINGQKNVIALLQQQLTITKQESLVTLEEALKAMLINGFSDDCVPVVKVKYQIKKLKGEA